MTLPSRFFILALFCMLFAIIVLTPSRAIAQTSGNIELSGTDPLAIDEGDTGSFTVKLDTEPDANVTVTIATADAAAVSLSTTSLTFTDQNYGTAQPVTVTGVDDADNQDESVVITVSATGGITADAETITVTVDDDEPLSGDIEVDPGTLTIDESDTGTFSVDLSVQPEADVTVDLESDNNDVTFSPASLTFTTTDWSTPQEVTVTAGDDDDDDNDTAKITLEASGGITADDVEVVVNVADDDPPPGEIELTAATLSIVEGASGTFSVDLSVEPDDDVTVTLAVSDNTDVTLSSASLTFTMDNYDDPQQVTVNVGQDDDTLDENATITLSATGGIDADDVTVTVNVDDDEPPSGNIELSDTGTLALDEGASGKFNVDLSVMPEANVTVDLDSDNDDVTASPSSLTFTTTTWNVPQEVTVSAAHDDGHENDTAEITLSATGGITASAVKKNVTVEDDDSPRGAIRLSNAGALTLVEGRQTGSFSVDLSVQPDADVIVSFTSDNPDVSVSPAQLTFTMDNDNWKTHQTVTVSAGHDDGADDDTAKLTLSATGGIRAPDVEKDIRVTDDDTARLLLSKGALTILEGGIGYFEIRPETKPTADTKVTIELDPSTGVSIDVDPDRRGLQHEPLIFKRNGQENAWNQNQRVTIFVALDDAAPDDRTIEVKLKAAPERSNETSDYNNMEEIVSVSVRKRPSGKIILDPDLAVADSLLALVEGDAKTIAVSLDTAPNENANVDFAHTLDQTPDSHLTISPGSLIFTPENYAQPQMVTFTPRQNRDDMDRSGTITVEVLSGIRAPEIQFDVTIADAPPYGRILFDEIDRIALAEGSLKVLNVMLDTLPIGGAQVAFRSNNADVTISPEVVHFNELNYALPRAVAIVAEQDSDRSDEDITITLSTSGGLRTPDEMIQVIVEDNDDTTPDWPVKTQALALPPADAQDDAIMRLYCKENKECSAHLVCAAQADGSVYEGQIHSIPANGALTLEQSDIERYIGESWSSKGRLGCALHSEQNISSQVWTRSGDGVLVNNSAFIRSVREGEMYRADIESIPSPNEPEESNIRIRCTSAYSVSGCNVVLACYDDAGMRYDGDLGAIERLKVRHLQRDELSTMIGHRWSGMGLSCEIRSNQTFTVQVMTRTGGGGALVNNSATGGRGSGGS